jgi:CHAD domain-containing protein
MRPARTHTDAAPARAIIATALAPSIDRLRDCRGVAGSGVRVEEVHQARVATRRLRSNLKNLRAVLHDHDDVRAELAWIGGLLGAVRDADVLRGVLDRLGVGSPDELAGGTISAFAALDRERDRALAALTVAVESQRFDRLLERLEALVADPPVGEDRDIAPFAVMEPAWRALKRAVDALDRDPADPALHDVRILTKQARYAAEMFIPTAGDDAQRFARRAARVQDALGVHQDAVVAVAWLLAHRTDDPDVALAVGWLAGRSAAVRDASRDAWRAPWAALTRPKARFW